MDSGVKANSFVCSDCGRHLSSKQRLRSHIKSNHSRLEISESSYRCNICGKGLSSKRNLQLHMNKLHGKSPVKSVYKTYCSDPTASVPKTTRIRQLRIAKKLGMSDFQDTPSSANIHVAMDECNEVAPEQISDSEHSDTDSVVFHEMPIESETGSDDQQSVNMNSPDSSHSPLSLDCEYEYGTDSESEFSVVDESSFDSSFSNMSSDADDVSASTESDVNNSSTELQPKSQTIDLCIQAYSKRFNLSSEASRYLKQLVSIVNPDLNQSQPATTQGDFLCFHYCGKCNELFPPDPDMFECQTANCMTLRYDGHRSDQMKSNRQPKNSFIIANLTEQIKNILEKPGVWQSIEEVKLRVLENNSESNIHDIVNGEGYKNLSKPGQFLNNKTHLSALINTDGIPLYSSSKVKLWPVFLAINEIPPAERFSRDNILIAGIWQGKGNPPFQQYISCLANEMNKLYSVGIDIQPVKCHQINVKLCIVCATLDLQAKAYVANMSMHNGEYGCSTCEEPGLVVKKGNGHVRSYPYRHAAERVAQRNSEAMKADAQLASRNNRIKGLCGVSGLSLLPEFEMALGLVPDYMHGVLLGVTKTLMCLWFSSSNSGKDFFVGNKLDEISQRLSGMTPPDTIERLPRNIEKHYAHFKATELQTWLLFYGIPCMHGILPDQYLSHFSLLSEGIFLLLGDNITQDELQRASMLLDKFYQQCDELYGQGVSGLNVHNVGIHLVEFVRLWGPLWCWSCFPFEDANAAILKAVHGTGDVTKQYINFKQSEMKLNKMAQEATSTITDVNTKHFLKCICKSGRKWTAVKSMDVCKTAGKLLIMPVEACTADLFHATMTREASDLKKCLRVEHNGQRYYSQEYSRMKKRVCHFVICQTGEIVSINFFVVNNEKQVSAVVQKYEISNDCFILRDSGKHIVKITQTDNVKTIPVNLIMDKLFFISVKDSMYVVRLPNQLGRSVIK